MKKLFLLVVLILVTGMTTQGQKRVVFNNLVLFQKNKYELSKNWNIVPFSEENKRAAIANYPKKIIVDEYDFILDSRDFIKKNYKETYEIWYEPDTELIKYRYIDTKFLNQEFSYEYVIIYIMIIILMILGIKEFITLLIKSMVSIFKSKTGN